MAFSAFLHDPARVSVGLLGFGRANRAVCDWLLERGARPVVYSEAPLPQEVVQQYAKEALSFRIGAFPPYFPEAVLMRSPGIRPDIPSIRASLARGSCLTAETELLMALSPATLIGVTGSDGKTTTANLTAALLRAAGHRVWLGGNNGTPLLPRVGEMKENDIAVLELSSFQLMTAAQAPSVAVITNITPNHLNWHTDMAEYKAAKCRIFAPETRLVLNAENEETRAIGAARGVGETLFFSSHAQVADFANSILPQSGAVYASGGAIHLLEVGKQASWCCLDAFSLPGVHNLENLLAAMAASAPFLTEGAPRAALRAFRGVKHRLELVGTVGGVAYYNSSIDTSPTRTAAALAALGARPLVIAGGRGKGISFAPLAAALGQYAKAVFLYGEAAGEIATALDAARGGVPHISYVRFADAFRAAAAAAASGDTVLLSPGCTAFGEFRDFEERGLCFCRLVEALAAERK